MRGPKITAMTDLSERGNAAQVTPRRRDAHCKLALVQAPFSLSAYFHPSSTVCTHTLHIFRDPRYALIMICLRLSATFTLLSFVSLFSFGEYGTPSLSLFVCTREKVYARARQLA